MALRIAGIGLVAGLLLASAAAGAVLLEQFEYEPPTPARVEGDR